MEIYVKMPFNPYFFFSGFQTGFYQMHWFYSYRKFQHSKWWCHYLGHT